VDERKEAALRTSFEDDVLPLLEKSRQIRWVNGWSMQAETQDRHFWWNRSPTDDRYEGISKPSGHFSRKAALEGEAWRKALFAHLRNPWVTVTLPLDAQQTTALRLFTEALGGFSDDIDNDRRPRCDHQIVRDFNTLENRKPGHGFDVVLSASRNALEGFVDCINVCLEAGKTIDLPVLCAAFEAVRRKREELKKEFQGYRPVIMPRQIGNDYGVFSECDGETRFSPDPLGLIEATDRMLALTKVQYSHMKNWSKGDFVERWDPCEDRPHSMTAEHYCEALTRIALEPCNGGALYPGIEVSREVLRKEIYQSAFRIDPALEPGSLTEGLAVPWQNDFFECNMEHAMSWWPASRPDNVFLRIPVDEVDVQGEEMSSWTGQVLNAETGRWREFLVNRTHRFMDDWSKLAVVVKKEVPPGIALVRVRPVREGPGYKSFDKITETDLLYAAVDEYEQWTRWWKASGCPPVEIEYYDLKASKRYLMDLRGITPPRSESSKEPVLGYVIDTVALEEWERTRRPDIEYYEKDGKFYKRYYVYVADVQDTSPREVHDERKLTPRMFPDDDQYPE
jgi:hypothetical protein